MATRRRDPEQIYRDVMAKFDAQTRDRIQGVIIDYGIEKADPFFLIFLAMGHLLTLVQTAPENWQVLFDEFKGDLDAWTTQNLRTLEAINQQSLISERLIRSFQALSNLTTSSNGETQKLHKELTRLNTELAAFKGSLIQAVNQNTANSQTLLNRVQTNEEKVALLESQMTWTLACSALTLAAVVIGGAISYGRLAKEVEFAQVLLMQERKRSIWTLEKANRAECFYGIKPQSDPQCQQF
ncbi:MAG: hypothetical protein DCF25_05875 [Leptolyngbya foveolarum]|uniref:Uncharacterized protein n=1 Tax=Leptolyngbya foveolarum TaxID=47253 RepID=A0A2W4W933_9CYAN|nr:MAG: hypothetical protein DCF25_05875 [Leptolyngbya foveolarum]